MGLYFVVNLAVLLAIAYFAKMYKATTKMKVMNHKRLQYYEHHYGMVCLTGMLGCRWHRYQQSQESSTKCDIAWYVVMLVTSLFTFFWFYFWLMAENSWNNLNWYGYDLTGSWKNFYGIVFILTCITLAYMALVNILALCHVGNGHQVHVHWFHKVILVAVLVMCVVMVIIISDIWSDGWLLQSEALMITGPFLHLGAVILMTSLCWMIAAHWMTLYAIGPRVAYLGLYVAAMAFLYLTPLLIHSPCIVERIDLPQKPKLVGHRGIAALSPENTKYSFQLSQEIVITLESDVIVSSDGLPFLMHDSYLKRTTDVKDVFPELANQQACWFNSSQLAELNAGSWFLETDPFKTVSSMSDRDRLQCQNQSIPTLEWLLQQAIATHANIMFDIKSMEACEGHPYHDTYEDIIINTILQSGIDPKKVWYLVGEEDTNPLAENLTQVLSENLVKSPLSPNELHDLNIQIVNAQFGSVPWETVRLYQDSGIAMNIYVVDEPWLYSLYWCMGIDSVTSNQAMYLSTLEDPVWLLTPRQFQAMWITTDVISAAIIILVFVIQHLRKTGKSLKKSINSERLSLQGARIRMSHLRRNRNMKEKLLHTVESLPDMDAGIAGASMEDITTQENHGSTSGIPRPRASPCGNPRPRVSPSAHHTPQSSISSSRASVGQGSENGDVVYPAVPNRFSAVSGWSGLSGISAISGTDVGDSSFGAVPPGDTSFTIGAPAGSNNLGVMPSGESRENKPCGKGFNEASLEVASS